MVGKNILITLSLLASFGVGAAEGHWNGGRTVPVHKLALLDADGDKVNPLEPSPRAFSQVQTCGQCHDVSAMRGASHFRTGLDTNDVPAKVNFEPWFLVDEKKGTVKALSLNGLDDTYAPAELGMSAFQFTLLFGRSFPGGGVGSDERTVGEIAGDKSRWFVTGPLEVNCLACHQQTPYDSSEWARQVARENFSGAAIASSGIGIVEGMNSRLEASWDASERRENLDDHLFKVPQKIIYDRNRFDHKNRLTFNVGKPKNENCLACHSVSQKGMPSHAIQGDVHLQRGMKCVDCHVNGMDHRVKTKGCADCHINPHGSGPKPRHEGFPVIHFTKLSCSVCHSGVTDRGTRGVVRTARANRIGIYGRAQWATDLPYIVEPVFVRSANGVIESHRLTWAQDLEGKWSALTWKFAHDVRPARKALGSEPERCAACHTADSGFFFGEIKPEGPMADKGAPVVKQLDLLKVNGVYHSVFGFVFAFRPLFKVVLWGVFAFLCLFAAAGTALAVARLVASVEAADYPKFKAFVKACSLVAFILSLIYLAVSGAISFAMGAMTGWPLVLHMVAGGALAVSTLLLAMLCGKDAKTTFGSVLRMFWLVCAAGVVFTAVMPMMSVFGAHGQEFLLWSHRCVGGLFSVVSIALCIFGKRN